MLTQILLSIIHSNHLLSTHWSNCLLNQSVNKQTGTGGRWEVTESGMKLFCLNLSPLKHFYKIWWVFFFYWELIFPSWSTFMHHVVIALRAHLIQFRWSLLSSIFQSTSSLAIIFNNAFWGKSVLVSSANFVLAPRILSHFKFLSFWRVSSELDSGGSEEWSGIPLVSFFYWRMNFSSIFIILGSNF